MSNAQALSQFKATIFDLPSNEQDTIKILAYTLRNQVPKGTVAYLGATLFMLQLQADIENDPTLLNDTTPEPQAFPLLYPDPSDIPMPNAVPHTPIDVPQVPHV